MEEKKLKQALLRVESPAKEKVHSVKHDDLKRIQEDIEKIRSVRKNVFGIEGNDAAAQTRSAPEPSHPIPPTAKKTVLSPPPIYAPPLPAQRKGEPSPTGEKRQEPLLKTDVSHTQPTAPLRPMKKGFFSFFDMKLRNNTAEIGKESFHQAPILARKKGKKYTKHRHMLHYHLEKCGFEIDDEVVMKRIVIGAAIINVFLTLVAFLADFRFSFVNNASWMYAVYLILTLWIFVFAALVLIIFLCVFIFLDLRMFQRKTAIEEVLPEFLHLTSSNVRAGMPIDQALWYAVRPNFGVLAKEIEQVAKSVMSGNDLRVGLEAFAKKYDSDMLQRSVSLIIEGMDAGGEIGDLLNKIANDINDSKILQQEMAANVTSYTIFITFASVAAAPFLFALSYVLLTVVSGLVGNISSSIDPTSASSLPFTIGGQSMAPGDFTIFAIAMLTVTSFFSALITSSIKHGDPRKGLRSIPIFIITSIILYFVGLKAFSGLMSGIL